LIGMFVYPAGTWVLRCGGVGVVDSQHFLPPVTPFLFFWTGRSHHLGTCWTWTGRRTGRFSISNSFFFFFEI
jgi:hypothetical protein